MILKKITIQNLGLITDFSHEFTEGLNIVISPMSQELTFAIRLIINHKITPPPNFSVGEDTKIEAKIFLSEKEYWAVATYDRVKNDLKLSCYDLYGNDVTNEYIYLTSRSYEQDLSDVFYDDGDKVLLRFLKYANEDLHYAKDKLADATGGLSKTNAFRRYLRSFIDNFEPELLRDNKEYEIVIEKNYRYAVRCKLDGSVTKSLSQSEKILFRYLCFLRTAEFWTGFEEMRNMHSIKKPIIICDFLEKLDESINTDNLLNRTALLNREAIILTRV